MPINPTRDQIAAVAALAGSDADGPLVMLNLNRYRDRAEYAGEVPGGEPAGVSGREAYQRYGVVALTTLQRLGGSIVFHGNATLTVVGDDEDRWDEVIAVRYPNAQAFLDLALDPVIGAALPHRDAGLERAAIIRCDDHAAVPAAAG